MNPLKLKRLIAHYLDCLPSLRSELHDVLSTIHTIQYESDLNVERAKEPRKLFSYGFKVFSQADEDGIIQEIFRRIGAGNTFAEIGADGVDNNSLYLLHSGWQGSWFDASDMTERFASLNSNGYLTLKQTMVTRENINKLIPTAPDFLSIDIDGNDYWIWDALEVSPKVVCIEYNATLRPPLSLVQEYNERRWDGTSYYGASLTALEKLGRTKGYSLIGCNYTGVNAFFVRDEYQDLFAGPFTADNHYEPPRYYAMRAGHRSGIGPYVQI